MKRGLSSLNHLNHRLRKTRRLPNDFLVPSLRHTNVDDAAVEAFSIIRIAGQSIMVSQRCVRPSSEAMEHAFERWERLNGTMGAKAEKGSVLWGTCYNFHYRFNRTGRKLLRALSTAVSAADS